MSYPVQFDDIAATCKCCEKTWAIEPAALLDCGEDGNFMRSAPDICEGCDDSGCEFSDVGCRVAA